MGLNRLCLPRIGGARRGELSLALVGCSMVLECVLCGGMMVFYRFARILALSFLRIGFYGKDR